MGDIAMDEDDFMEYKDHKYLEEKMGSSLHELQIEDPSTMGGIKKGPYSQYDNIGEKDNEKEVDGLNKKKKSKRKCAKG